MYRYLLTTVILLLLIPTDSEAQFGNIGKKVLDKSKDKLERKIEDKVVEKLSEEIARMAFKPINSAMDSMLKSSYEDDQGGNVDWSKAGASYGDFLEDLNKAANVPDEYVFNIQVDAEMKDYDKEKHDIVWLYSTEHKYMGIEQKEGKKETLIVIDNENDVMVMYSDENGNRTAQALPSMIKLSSAFVNQQNNDTNQSYNMTFNKIDKTKKIAGYESQGYKFDSEEEEGDAWIALKFPVDFFNVFGNAYAQFMPKTYSETFEGTKGMIMASEYQNKKDKKLKSSYKVKKVKEKERKIDNAEWGLGNAEN